MASFAERMAAHKAASNSTPAAPVVATAVPVAQPATKAEIIVRPEPEQVVGINPPSGVPEGAPVMLGEFDPDRQSKGPFYQNDDGEWVQLKGLKKPELKDAVKVLAARVRDAGLTATFEHNLTASTLDMKQIAADAKINVEGLRQTAALLIRTLARDNEDELRRAGVDALPTSVPEHRLTAVRIERAGGSRAEALVNLLKDGCLEEFVRLVNVSFEAPMSEDLLARTIALVPQVKALPLPVPDVHIAASPEVIDEVLAQMTDDGEIDYNALKQNDPPEGIAAHIAWVGQDAGGPQEAAGLLFWHTEIKPEHYLREEGSVYVRLVKPDATVTDLTYHLQRVNEKYTESLVPREMVEEIAKGILYPNHKFEEVAEKPAAVVAQMPPDEVVVFEHSSQIADDEEFDLEIELKMLTDEQFDIFATARDALLKLVKVGQEMSIDEALVALKPTIDLGDTKSERHLAMCAMRAAALMLTSREPEKRHESPKKSVVSDSVHTLRLFFPSPGIKHTLDTLTTSAVAAGQSADLVQQYANDYANLTDTAYLGEEAAGLVRQTPGIDVHVLIEELCNTAEKYCAGVVPQLAIKDIALKVSRNIKPSNVQTATLERVVATEPVVVAEPDAESFAERIKTLTNAARWAKHMNKDVMAYLVEINAKLNPPVAENALRAVVSDVCGVVVPVAQKADDAFKLVRELKVQVEGDALATCTSHGDTAPIIAVGCEIAGPLLMQDFEAILTNQFEPKIAKKTGAQYGQAAYSEDYKLMAGLVEHYGKKQFDQHKNGVMTLNSFRRDRQYILDGLARAGWIILNGRG